MYVVSSIIPAVSDTVVFSIIKYGSTFYIGIAMVILPYFGPIGKLKFKLIIYEKKKKKLVILVISIFTELLCSFSSASSSG